MQHTDHEDCRCRDCQEDRRLSKHPDARHAVQALKKAANLLKGLLENYPGDWRKVDFLCAVNESYVLANIAESTLESLLRHTEESLIEEGMANGRLDESLNIISFWRERAKKRQRAAERSRRQAGRR